MTVLAHTITGPGYNTIGAGILYTINSSTAQENDLQIFIKTTLPIILKHHNMNISTTRGGRVVRRCWVNCQCRGVLLTWMTVGQGPIVLAVGAGGGCLDIFSLIYHFSFLSPSLWEMARNRLKYCLKGLLSPKQPTNHVNNKHLFQLTM